MTKDELAYTLKEDDFLFVKLQDKPDVPPVKYEPLTEEQAEQTKKVKEWIKKYFDGYRDKITVNDFDFIKDYGKPARIKKNVSPKAVVLNEKWNVKDLSNCTNAAVFIKMCIRDSRNPQVPCNGSRAL